VRRELIAQIIHVTMCSRFGPHGDRLPQHPIDRSPADAEALGDGGGTELLLLLQAPDLAGVDAWLAALVDAPGLGCP
jgi:hypothetical protein